MDDRDQPDTNVVSLRRKEDLDAGQREQLASTIFAEEDEISTFSRGNLVPPRADAAEELENTEASADPFFDRYAQERANGAASDDNSGVESGSTAEYFDQMSARTAAEMAAATKVPAAVSAMPGSARLPADLRIPLRGRRVRRRTLTSEVSPAMAPDTEEPSGWLRLRARAEHLRFRRLHVVLAVTTGASLALGGMVILAQPSTPRATARLTASAASQVAVFDKFKANVERAIAAISRSAEHRVSHPPSKHGGTLAHLRHKAARSERDAAVATTSPPVTAAQSKPYNPLLAPSQPRSSPPATTSSASSDTSGASSASGSSRPAFGQNGTLGPGHSPNS